MFDTQVIIESDADMQCTLCNFKEAKEEDKLAKYRTIHVQECVEVILERDDRLEPLEPRPPCKRALEKQYRGKVSASKETVCLIDHYNHCRQRELM